MLTPPLIAPTLVVHSWGGTDSPVEVRPRARDQNAIPKPNVHVSRPPVEDRAHQALLPQLARLHRLLGARALSRKAREVGHPYRTIRAPHALSPRRYPPRAAGTGHSRPFAPDASQHGSHPSGIQRRRGAIHRSGRAVRGGANRGHVPRGVPEGTWLPPLARPPNPVQGCWGVPLRRRAPLFGTPVPLPASPPAIRSSAVGPPDRLLGTPGTETGSTDGV